MNTAGDEPTLIAIAVVEHEGRFLVGVRPEGIPLAGFWEFPGGKVEPHEPPAQAAVRECLEETGLKVAVVSVYPAHVHRYDHGQVHLVFFRCRLTQGDFPPRAPFRWVDRTELRALQFPSGNAELLALLQEDA